MASVPLLASMSSYEAGKVVGMLVGLMLVVGIPALFIVAVTKAGKSTGWRITAIVTGIFGGLMVVGAVASVASGVAQASRKLHASPTAGKTKSISSAEGEVTMTVPVNWQPFNQGNKSLLLGYIYTKEPKCLFVASMSKGDFTGNLSDYQKMNKDNLLIGMPQLELSQAENKPIGGYPALRWSATGEVNQILSCYRLATVESKGNFYLITISCEKSGAEANAEEFDQIIESFTAKEGPPER